MRISVTSLVMALTATACAERPRMEPSLLERDWTHTRVESRRNAEAGNYHAADRLLAEFARVHPDTREARETVFWRGAYLVDPANTLGSLNGGISALDAYLVAEPDGWYRNEAEILRRTAVAARGLASGAGKGWVPDTVAIVTPASESSTPPRRSRDEEIAELRTQLARSKSELAEAQAELERIKKRLANPSP